MPEWEGVSVSLITTSLLERLNGEVGVKVGVDMDGDTAAGETRDTVLFDVWIRPVLMKLLAWAVVTAEGC